MISTDSSNRRVLSESLKRGMPYAMCSDSREPAPIPRIRRPLDRTSNVAAILARWEGYLKELQETSVPILILLVTVARAPRVVQLSRTGSVGGPIRAYCMKWSESKIESNPRSEEHTSELQS